VSVCAVCATQLSDGPSAAEELLEEDTSVENERESISKASPWNLAA
jgi:hypothetical protein